MATVEGMYVCIYVYCVRCRCAYADFSKPILTRKTNDNKAMKLDKNNQIVDEERGEEAIGLAGQAVRRQSSAFVFWRQLIDEIVTNGH